MAQNINHLPYFKTKNSPAEIILAKFLQRKFLPGIRKLFPEHYLIQPVVFKKLEFVKKTMKRYPFFLRFDIASYYPSINHQELLKKLPQIYQSVSEKPLSRRFRKYLKKDMPAFLAKSPYEKGLPVGSPLSYILAGVFLLELDLAIKNPFLQYNDDYLVFCKSEKEPEKILAEIILPKLRALNLTISEKKLKSGRFFRDKVDFLGYEFYAGYFSIKEEKLWAFKQKIKNITYLTKKKPIKAPIKLLNNQILGFAHYYKFASCKEDFAELDGFIRSRLRRYVLKQKELLPKEGNLFLTNYSLKNMGLKSLSEIKERFDNKNSGKIKKSSQNKQDLGKNKQGLNWALLQEAELKYKLNYISNKIDELTSLIRKLENKQTKLEKKLALPKSQHGPGKRLCFWLKKYGKPPKG